jgi:hypothetical protein
MGIQRIVSHADTPARASLSARSGARPAADAAADGRGAGRTPTTHLARPPPGRASSNSRTRPNASGQSRTNQAAELELVNEIGLELARQLDLEPIIELVGGRSAHTHAQALQSPDRCLELLESRGRLHGLERARLGPVDYGITCMRCDALPLREPD